MADRTRNYTMQRNYEYDTQNANSKYKGLTEDEWKELILDEWSCDKLNADSVTIIFHDKCNDDNGLPKPLHAHNCTHFKDAITHTEAIKRGGCSSDKNCKAIGKKAQAYKYLLHITEQAIKDKKHIYGEDELIIFVADGKSFDYHKIIQASEEEEDDKDAKKLLKNTINLILQGFYGEERIMSKLLLEDEIVQLMAMKPTNKRTIENAIETYYESNQAKKAKEAESTPKQKFDFDDMLKRFTE